jgi:hypothetical protein
LYHCYINAPGWEDHFIQAYNCGGWVQERLIGYVLPAENPLFFADLNFSGAYMAAGSDVSFVGWTWNDQITSVKVPAGRTVVLYTDINFGGASLTLTSDAPDLRMYAGPGRGGTWNDAVSSFRIY